MESDEKIHNFFTEILAIDFLGSETVLDENVKTGIYDLGNTKIETLEAINEQSVIKKFIDKKGQSLHHIALLVDNISEIHRLTRRSQEILSPKTQIKHRIKHTSISETYIKSLKHR